MKKILQTNKHKRSDGGRRQKGEKTYNLNRRLCSEETYNPNIKTVLGNIEKTPEQKYMINIMKIENGKSIVKEYIDTDNIYYPNIEKQNFRLTTQNELSGVVESIVCILLFKGYTEFLIDMFDNEGNKAGEYNAKLFEEWNVKKIEYSGIYKSSNMAIQCLLNKISSETEIQKQIFSMCIEIINNEMK